MAEKRSWQAENLLQKYLLIELDKLIDLEEKAACMNCICKNEFDVDCEYCNQLGMGEEE